MTASALPRADAGYPRSRHALIVWSSMWKPCMSLGIDVASITFFAADKAECSAPQWGQ